MRGGQRLKKLARRYQRAAQAAERAEAFSLLLDWGRHYLSAHFSHQSSPMHRWLEAQLARADEVRPSTSLTAGPSTSLRTGGCRVNLVGPRGHAKSTVATLAYVLKCAVERREPYIWIVSDTREQAQLHLENVKRELVENSRLAADYPLSVGKGPSTSLRTGRSTKLTTGRQWQRHAIELANGVVIEAWSTGQRIRGRRRREYRPTLIVCDDLQNDSHMSSAAQREATRRWFHGTLLKAGTKATNVVNLATALHRDALAVELLTAPGWTSARFAAIEAWPTNLELWREWEEIYTRGSGFGVQGSGNATEPQTLNPEPTVAARAFYEAHRVEMDAGAEVLWPEVEDLYTLMRMRVESGHAAFEREKQGSPVDPERCEWPTEYFGEHLWFESWESAAPVVKTMALDPSKGRDAGRGDYSAIVMLGIDAAGVIYVEADLARRATPQMVADSVAWCGRFRPLVFGVEANQYQELLAGEIDAELARQQVVGIVPAAIHNYINKQVRIRRLGPLLSQRRLRFLAGSASTKLVVEQLQDFPAGAHDDGPDALEMALRLAEEIWLGRSADDGLGSRLIGEP